MHRFYIVNHIQNQKLSKKIEETQLIIKLKDPDN